MNDDFDDLDRALFAMPLETPPPDLRASILRATVHAAPVAAVAFSAAEVVGIGVALAVAAWLIIAAAADHALAVAVGTSTDSLVRAMANPTTLAWLATGGSVAVVLTLSNFAGLGGGMRNRRS